MYLNRGHSASRYVNWQGVGSRWRKQQKKDLERKVYNQKNLDYFLVSHEALTILKQATETAHLRNSLTVYLKWLYNICTKNIIIPLLWQLGCLYIHVYLKIQWCLKMLFSTSFDITWCAKAEMYAKKIIFSYSIVS